MALKKGMFENYLKEREVPLATVSNESFSSKYSHNRVFDEPESLKQVQQMENSFEQGNHPININQTLKKISANKTEHKLNTNLTQKLDTNLAQTEHKKIKKRRIQTQSIHKLNTKLNTQKTQTTYKVDTNITQSYHISTLIGLQRKLLLYVFEACKKSRSHITEPLSINHLSSALEIHLGSIKTSIKRLCEKEFIKINSFKNGRGGWSVYEIYDHIYKELLQMETQYKLHTNLTQSGYKVDTKLNTQPDTTLSSSSSILNIKETTTRVVDGYNFDISIYEKNFGFKLSHLRQLASLNVITALDVEQSLLEFNYDLENNSLPVIKTNKLNFLIGLLRTGNCYISENYRNEQEQAIKLMAERTKKKKQMLLEEKFVTWEASLSTEAMAKILHNILPRHLINEYKSEGMTSQIKRILFSYYTQEISEKEEQCFS
jgi:hypothetical protein